MRSVLLAIVLFLLQGLQARMPASIEGMVIQSSTSRPVVGARVTIGIAETLTDDGGKFVFRNVQPGRYHVSVNHNDYIPAPSTDRTRAGHGGDVTVSPGETAKDIVLVLLPKGSISGRVYDPNRDAVPNAAVQALKYAYQDGRRILVPAGNTLTNKLGEYSLASLAPGPYIVRAAPLEPFQDHGEGHLPVYFPNTTNPAMASAVDLPPGINFTGVDLTIMDAPTVRISGRVANGLTGESAVGAAVSIVPRRGTVATGSLQRTTAATGGAFEFRRMTPGSYDVLAIGTSAGSARVAASTPVDVGSGDIDNVSLVLQPQFTVDGRLSVENVQDPADINLRSVRVELRREPFIPELLILLPPVTADGIFTLTGVTPGDYRLTLNTGGLNGYIRSARFGSVDALDPPFPISGPGQFEIVIALNSGSLNAIVLDDVQKPLPRATVVLVPDAPRRQRFDLYYAAGCDESGRVHFGNIAPGDYRIFAWDDVQADSWQDPEFLRLYEDRGKPVHITEASVQNVEVKSIRRF